MRFRLLLVVAAVAAGLPGLCSQLAAQDTSSVVIPRGMAERHGLTRAWLTQVEIGGSQDRVQNVEYWIAEPPPPPKKPIIQGDPEVLPKKQSEPMEVEDLLRKPPPPPPVVPIEAKSSLFVLSRRGVLQAIDAETGRTFWTTQVGGREKPSLGPSVGKLYVAVVNGNTLYVLDRRDGGVTFKKDLGNVASAGPAMGDQWVYVPMLSGNVVAYRLPDVRLGAAPPPTFSLTPPGAKVGAPKPKDNAERNQRLRDAQREEYAAGRVDSMTYSSYAPVNNTPLIAGDRIAWTTAKGQVYTGFNDRAHVDNRFDALRPIESPLTHWTPYFYAAGRDGYVYGIHERRLDNPWRYSIGEPLYQPAVGVEDSVYAIGERNGLYCLDAMSGNRRWWTPGIRRFLALSAKRIYTIDNGGDLQVLDRATGAQVDQLNLNRIDIQVLNQRSDRIFLGTSGGVLQCLHEMGQSKPLLHFPKPDVKPEAKGPKIGGQPKEEPKAEEPKKEEAEPKKEEAKQ